MNRRAYQAYADTQVETAVCSARPVDLVVMVYDRLFEHLRSAETAMQTQQSADVAITKALELIGVGLQSCLNLQEGGEIADNLAVLYDWANRQILLGKLKKDPMLLAEVRRVLTPLAEAWRTHAQSQSEAFYEQSLNYSSGLHGTQAAAACMT